MSGFPPNLLAGERYAVCGLGRNGAAVVQALLGMGAQVQAWDDHNADLPAQPNLTVAPLTDLSGMTALILSPGIPHLLPKAHPVADLAREQGFRFCPMPRSCIEPLANPARKPRLSPSREQTENRRRRL